VAFQLPGISSTLGLDVSPFAKGIAEANGLASAFGSTVATFMANPLLGVIQIASQAGRAIVSGFGAAIDAIREIGSAADDAGEAAERLGVSVEFLTGIGAAFADAGSSAQGFSEALKFLNKNAGEAAQGNKDLASAFAQIGVSVTGAGGELKGTEQLFFEVADAIASLPTAAQQTTAAMTLLGRSGAESITALNKGSGGLKEFAADIEALGGTITKDLAKSGDAFGTLGTYVEAGLQGIKRAVAAPVLAAIQEHFGDVRSFVLDVFPKIQGAVQNAMTGIVNAVVNLTPVMSATWEVAKQVWGWIEGTAVPVVKDLLVGAFNILSPVVEGLGPVFTGLWSVLKGVWSVVGPLAEAVGNVLGPALQVVGDIVGALLDKFGRLLDYLGRVIGKIGEYISASEEAADAPAPGSRSAGSAGGAGGATSAAPAGVPIASAEMIAAAAGVAPPSFGSATVGGQEEPKWYRNLAELQSGGGSPAGGGGGGGGGFVDSATTQLVSSVASIWANDITPSVRRVVDDLRDLVRRGDDVFGRLVESVSAAGAGQSATATTQPAGETAGTRIENLTLHVDFDPDAAASEIAKRISGPLRAKFDQVQSSFAAAALAARIGGGL
jgi:TP901 family phage tail tape measure protein